MNPLRWTILSLGLNAVLAIIAVALWTRVTPPPAGTMPAVVRVITNAKPVIMAEAPSAPPPPSIEPVSFRWNEIAAEDLAVYASNLRQAGCPQATIRDIIGGELEDIYLRRRRALMAPLQNDFWNLARRGLESKNGRFDKVKEEVEKLEEETIDRLDELAGKEETKSESGTKQHNPRLAFLSEEKQGALEALNQKHVKLRQEESRGPDGKRVPIPREKVAEWKKQLEEEVKQLLTPEEYLEYRLRHARSANLASRLVGFETTEEELRAIAKVRLDFDGVDTPLDRKASDYQTKLAQQQESKRQRDAAVKSLLGEQRYAEFTQAQDGAYQQIYRVAERYGLPRETAMAVDEVRRTALDQAKAVKGNKALPGAQRQELLRSLRQETERTLTQTFGEGPLQTYRKYGGNWLDGIGGR